MKKAILSILVLTVFVALPTAYAGKVELTTYYPAPYGEYGKLQSKGSCVGTNCTAADMVDGNLKVKQSTAGTGGDLTVEGKIRVGGSGSKGFVLQKGTPTSPEEGQMWIE